MSTEKCGCGHMMYGHDAAGCLVVGCECVARDGYHKPNTDSGRMGKLPCEAVWWTDETACKFIGEEVPTEWPEYLRDMYRSRFGRVGHGRLWIHPDFITGHVELPRNPLGQWIRGEFSIGSPPPLDLGGAAGIVLIRAHARFLNGYPGTVRDLRLVTVYDPPAMGNQARYVMV